MVVSVRFAGLTASRVGRVIPKNAAAPRVGTGLGLRSVAGWPNFLASVAKPPLDPHARHSGCLQSCFVTQDNEVETTLSERMRCSQAV